MPSPPLDIPFGVIDWIRDVFQQVNLRSSTTISRNPNIFETTLDHALIAHLAEFSTPFKFPSDWIVSLDTHFLGGGRYWGQWEIADIGILVVFRRKGQTLATKLALMQSKRLYPDEIELPVDMHPMDYMVGFGRLLESDSQYKSHVKPRTFHFSPDSKYRALAYKEEQYEAILKYSQDLPVHYLLYNPLTIPFTAQSPASTQSNAHAMLDVGCRVMKSETIDRNLKPLKLKKASSPSFKNIAGQPMASDFWTLHNFVADLVLGCQEGHLAGTDPFTDPGLHRVFNLRSGPISTAISVTIDAPTE